jgi:peptidoglycan lytic transglycosylase
MVALVAAAVALAGCAHKKRTSLPPAVPVRIGHTETGIASWYGHPYDGRPAADGEIYHMEEMVAAHRTMPFNTWVRVYNLTNHKSVEVRIIDRGPFIRGRIIDLSHAAAKAIDMIGPGTARVRLVVIDPPETATAGTFAVQVGIFRSRASAEQVRARMAADFGRAQVVARPGNPTAWRVLVGAEPTEEAATVLAGRIRDKSGETNAFVVRLDTQR